MLVRSASILFAVMVGVAACSTTPPAVQTDASTEEGDSPPNKDAGKDAGRDASKDSSSGPSCPTPQDVSSYKPATLKPPSGKRQNKCTTQQLADYKGCINGDMTKCTQFQQGMSGEACVNCIETDKNTSAQLGPLVLDGMNAFLNVEGCINLALGEMGAMSCGQLLHESYGCQEAACSEICAGDDTGFSKCVDTSLKTNCKSYGDKFDMACGAKIDGDGAPSEVGDCFSKQNEPSIDWQMRLTAYFCGP